MDWYLSGLTKNFFFCLFIMELQILNYKIIRKFHKQVRHPLVTYGNSIGIRQIQKKYRFESIQAIEPE